MFDELHRASSGTRAAYLPCFPHSPLVALRGTALPLNHLTCHCAPVCFPPARQSLQRDCEDLRRQLARCTPSEFERLHSQLMVAQRAAAEVPLVQDQLARQRQLWQGAEERLAKLQVGRCRAGGWLLIITWEALMGP